MTYWDLKELNQIELHLIRWNIFDCNEIVGPHGSYTMCGSHESILNALIDEISNNSEISFVSIKVVTVKLTKNGEGWGDYNKLTSTKILKLQLYLWKQISMLDFFICKHIFPIIMQLVECSNKNKDLSLGSCLALCLYFSGSVSYRACSRHTYRKKVSETFSTSKWNQKWKFFWSSAMFFMVPVF